MSNEHSDAAPDAPSVGRTSDAAPAVPAARRRWEGGVDGGAPAAVADRPVARRVQRELVEQAMADVVRQRAEDAWRRRLAAPADWRAGEPARPSPALVALLAGLRERVGGHVRRQRRRGLPVERVLPEVKALVREAEAREAWPGDPGALAGQVVRWAIEAYYDEPELQNVPRFY